MPSSSKTPERAERLADLLRSLEASLSGLRHEAEALREGISALEVADLKDGAAQLRAIEGLIRTCQKVEISLAEYDDQRDGAAGSTGFDTERARAELERCFDRLGAAGGSETLS